MGAICWHVKWGSNRFLLLTVVMRLDQPALLGPGRSQRLPGEAGVWRCHHSAQPRLLAASSVRERAAGWCPAKPSLPSPRGQPPAARCQRAGSGAASCREVRCPRRSHRGHTAAPYPTGGPASCETRAPAPAQLTRRASRKPGPCAAQRGVASYPGTQATQSECSPFP